MDKFYKFFTFYKYDNDACIIIIIKEAKTIYQHKPTSYSVMNMLESMLLLHSLSFMHFLGVMQPHLSTFSQLRMGITQQFFIRL